MKLQETQNRINQLLTQFVGEVKGKNSVGHMDISRISETILIPLLKEIYGYQNLRNLNDTERTNYPGIDLADDKERIAFQVTATPDSSKVKQTLRQFVKNRLYDKYSRVIIYVLTDRLKSYSARGLKEIIGEAFSFDPKTDIWDYRTLLKKVNSFQIEQASRVVAILENNFEVGQQGFCCLQIRQPEFCQPHSLHENFAGRLRERRELTKWFTRAESEKPMMVVRAIGGMGKSALTWVWLHQDVLGLSLKGFTAIPSMEDDGSSVPKEDRPDGVFWWSFEGSEATFSAFLDQALIYTNDDQSGTEVASSISGKIERLLKLLQKHRFLLVLDGFERELKIHAADSRFDSLREVQADEGRDDAFRSCKDPREGTFLSKVASRPMQSRVLLTSRYLPVEIDGLAGLLDYDLKSLDPADARMFFHAQKIHGPLAEIQMACEAYGYHPLALRLLAGLIVHDLHSPGDVRVARRYDVSPDLKGKREDHILHVAYHSLNERNRTLLSCIAAFRNAMPHGALSLFNYYGNEKEFDSALRELISRGLLSPPDQNRFDMHPVVRRYAYERLEATQRRDIHKMLSRYFAGLARESEPKTDDDLNLLIEHYHHLARSGQYKKAYAIIHDKLFAKLHYELGDYTRNIELLNELFPDGEKKPPRLSKRFGKTEIRQVFHGGSVSPPRPGRESPQVWAMTKLGISYRTIGSPESAVKLLKSAIDICKQIGDKDSLAEHLVNLSDVQWTIGDFKSVDENLRLQINLSREIGDKSHEVVGHQDLGLRLAFRGQWSEANKELETAQKLSRELKDPHREAIIWSHKTRKELLEMRAMSSGKLNKTAARKVLAAAKRSFRLLGHGPFERNRVRAYWLLGEAYRVNGDLTRTEEYLYQALRECCHINLLEFEADILLGIAELHAVERKKEEAREQAEAALRIAQRSNFVLAKADAHLFLAKMALKDGNRNLALKCAEEARASAVCDGPPDYTYKVAYDEAMTLLAQPARTGTRKEGDQLPGRTQCD